MAEKRNSVRSFLTQPAGLLLPLLLAACNSGDGVSPVPVPDPDPEVFRLPVVVHVIHNGEPVGIGFNLSEERIRRQIEIINEDYRRKPGTRGFNEHPDGGDALIEFVPAEYAPDGSRTDGIVRINANDVANPVPPNQHYDHYAYYSYWNPAHYLNIWTMPLPEELVDIVLGLATGPVTDLAGGDMFTPGEPHQAEGVLINAQHFGESGIVSEYNLGRTLTHEIGHYLGLLHPWGTGDCETNDFCSDTPPVTAAVTGCPPGPLGCNGQPAMVENFMNYAFDRCMNTFTNDQIARMHYVLEHSPRRASLLVSPGLPDR